MLPKKTMGQHVNSNNRINSAMLSFNHRPVAPRTVSSLVTVGCIEAPRRATGAFGSANFTGIRRTPKRSDNTVDGSEIRRSPVEVGR